jgi:hypothetical protein
MIKPAILTICALLVALPVHAQSQWLDKDAAIDRRAARSHYYERMRQACKRAEEGSIANSDACARARENMNAINRGAAAGTLIYTTPPAPAFCDKHPDAWDCTPMGAPRPAKPWKIPE